jgi:ubiquinone biosynthesis protein COQ4
MFLASFLLGRQLLLDKPLISTSTVDLAYLSSLPDETFGKQYAIFLASHQFSPDERSRVRFMADAELAYIMTRYRQVHDFWHVLFDVPISVLGEIALKWVEFYVTGLPVCYMSGVFGPLKLSVEEKRILDQVGIPWARQASEAFKDNQLLLTFKYESHFSSNIQDIRDKLQVIKAPKFT